MGDMMEGDIGAGDMVGDMGRVIGMLRGGRKEAGELRVSMLMKEEVSMLLMETDRWCRSLAETLTSRPEAPLATNLKTRIFCIILSIQVPDETKTERKKMSSIFCKIFTWRSPRRRGCSQRGTSLQRPLIGRSRDLDTGL